MPSDPTNVFKGKIIGEVKGVMDYGHGVYYLEAEGSEFVNTLSFLSAKYPGQVSRTSAFFDLTRSRLATVAFTKA